MHAFITFQRQLKNHYQWLALSQPNLSITFCEVETLVESEHLYILYVHTIVRFTINN